MSQNRNQQLEVDEQGRRVHRVGGRRTAQIAPDRMYRQQWVDDKIDKTRWCQLLAGALPGVEATPEAVANAAKVADYAYIELMLRERDLTDD